MAGLGTGNFSASNVVSTWNNFGFVACLWSFFFSSSKWHFIQISLKIGVQNLLCFKEFQEQTRPQRARVAVVISTCWNPTDWDLEYRYLQLPKLHVQGLLLSEVILTHYVKYNGSGCLFSLPFLFSKKPILSWLIHNLDWGVECLRVTIQISLCF